MRRRFSGYSWWVYLGGVTTALLGFAVLAGAGWLLLPSRPAVVPTALITLIPAPTTTPQPPTPEPEQAITATLAGQVIDGIGQGAYVQITNTGGDGLRLRRDPGTASDILFLGYDAEVFKVTGGPQIVDGYTWWYLTAPYDESRSGWAASNYLGLIAVETPAP